MNTAQDEEVWDEDLPNERHLYKYFWKRHSVFSQQYPCAFEVDGISHNCAEQYIMHQKAGIGFLNIAEFRENTKKCAQTSSCFHTKKLICTVIIVI